MSQGALPPGGLPPVVAHSELSYDRAAALCGIFYKYDSNHDGYLELNDMKVLGWAISGRRRYPTDAETALQISRADIDGDGKLSLAEFLRYSILLSRMPESEFMKLIMLLEMAHAEAALLGLTSSPVPVPGAPQASPY